MVRTVIPRSLQETMDERLVYEVMRGGKFGLDFPAYGEEFSDKLREEIERIPLEIQRDIVWCVLADAHEKWRSQPEIIRMILNEECSNCLNAFLKLELAGPDVFMIWARKLKHLFEPVGFQFKSEMGLVGYDTQMSWMFEIDFTFSGMLREVYLTNRRRFVEDTNMAGTSLLGKRDLYEYVTSTRHDVLNACSWREDANQLLRGSVRHALYSDDETSLAFRLTRQIILANGGGAPIDW